MNATSPRRLWKRQNLTIRMSMRCFTRLTNGFSKKVENHAYAVALHFHALQFRARSQDAPRDARDGRWPRHAHLELGRTGGLLGRCNVEAA